MSGRWWGPGGHRRGRSGQAGERWGSKLLLMSKSWLVLRTIEERGALDAEVGSEAVGAGMGVTSDKAGDVKLFDDAVETMEGSIGLVLGNVAIVVEKSGKWVDDEQAGVDGEEELAQELFVVFETEEMSVVGGTGMEVAGVFVANDVENADALKVGTEGNEGIAQAVTVGGGTDDDNATLDSGLVAGKRATGAGGGGELTEELAMGGVDIDVEGSDGAKGDAALPEVEVETVFAPGGNAVDLPGVIGGAALTGGRHGRRG